MTRSYWHIKNKDLIAKKPAFELPERVDIAVIGGGIVGIAVAHYLRAMGCGDIIVLEKEHVAFGASGRNAGFLLSGLAEPYSRLVVGLGKNSARDLTQATIENHNLMAEAIERNNIGCDYRRTGSFHLAVSEIEANELRDSVELLCRDGFEGDYVGQKDISGRLGFGRYCGGFFNPVDGNLDPYQFVNGLARGTRVVEKFEVMKIEKSQGGIRISSKNNAISAEMAVLATNAYSPLLDDFFKALIYPVRGQMLSASTSGAVPLRDKTYYANFGYDYFRQTSDNVVLMGGLRNLFIESEVGFEDSINPALQKGLEDYVSANLAMADFQVENRWTGVMGNTVDGLPLVGPLPHNSGVIAAVGYNGHGFGLGMIVARDVARGIVSGETSDLLRRFSLKRFAA
jgi:glycine/D-amino acid oxidase-like deaminating enzyme